MADMADPKEVEWLKRYNDLNERVGRLKDGLQKIKPQVTPEAFAVFEKAFDEHCNFVDDWVKRSKP